MAKAGTLEDSAFISPYGEIKVRWWLENWSETGASVRNGFYLEALVPPNTRAVVKLPSKEDVIEVGSGFHQWYNPES